MRLNDGRALPNFVYQALTGQPITVYGSGRQTRSFCYVSDLIEGIYRLMSPTSMNLPTLETLTKLRSLNSPSEFARCWAFPLPSYLNLCRRTIPSSVARIFPRRGACWAGNQK